MCAGGLDTQRTVEVLGSWMWREQSSCTKAKVLRNGTQVVKTQQPSEALGAEEEHVPLRRRGW